MFGQPFPQETAFTLLEIMLSHGASSLLRNLGKLLNLVASDNLASAYRSTHLLRVCLFVCLLFFFSSAFHNPSQVLSTLSSATFLRLMHESKSLILILVRLRKTVLELHVAEVPSVCFLQLVSLFFLNFSSP